jgi:protoporphyrinogen oxidase
MWNVHGKGGAAIRISVNTDRFCQHIQEQGYHLAFGRVTYEGMTSLVRPQFLVQWGLTEAEDSIHHFFFHKRGCYEWEQEFRVILASTEPVSIGLIDGMIESVIMSPIQRLDSNIENLLRERFGDRVRL